MNGVNGKQQCGYKCNDGIVLENDCAQHIKKHNDREHVQEHIYYVAGVHVAGRIFTDALPECRVLISVFAEQLLLYSKGDHGQRAVAATGELVGSIHLVVVAIVSVF